MRDVLVIACGNSLRGDDAIAHHVAAAVVAWQVPGVRVVQVHQLTPELIEEMKAAHRVVFVDAALGGDDAPCQTRQLAPQKSRRQFGHHEAPENLLALLAELENHQPEAWLVSIRGQCFDHGAPLTDVARRHASEALAWLHEFLVQQPPRAWPHGRRACEG